MQCLRTFDEFCSIQKEWEEFTTHYFPDNYSKTYPWLAAWWKTYNYNKKVCIYIKKDSEGKISSAVPLYICWELLSGLPVKMVHTLGRGIGTDEFMIPNNHYKFINEIFENLNKYNWNVARFDRISNNEILTSLLKSANYYKYSYTVNDSYDFLIRLPKDLNIYLQSRSKKFRRTLSNAKNRLYKLGEVHFQTLDPYKDSLLVQSLGENIAVTSWQYQENKSHFNRRHGETFYSNLTQIGKRAGGEDFNLLCVNGKPVAYLLGCKRGRTYFAIDTAYHADFKNISAGRILYLKIIERLINEGDVDFIDFEGAGEYKQDYANEIKKTKHLTIYSKSFYSFFLKGFSNSYLLEKLRKIKNY